MVKASADGAFPRKVIRAAKPLGANVEQAEYVSEAAFCLCLRTKSIGALQGF